MDQIKIGKFIAEMRKEQNFTQIDLAEKLGISNKTISKWECGNGMPDYAVMENLCEALHINVNELLSGERLPSKEYNKKAEENIQQIRKSMVAVKTVIVTVNIAGVLAALVGIIESLRVWAQSDYEVQLVILWISVALLSCCYALVISLILTPIYMRLKNKLIVE